MRCTDTNGRATVSPVSQRPHLGVLGDHDAVGALGHHAGLVLVADQALEAEPQPGLDAVGPDAGRRRAGGHVVVDRVGSEERPDARPVAVVQRGPERGRDLARRRSPGAAEQPARAGAGVLAALEGDLRRP